METRIFGVGSRGISYYGVIEGIMVKKMETTILCMCFMLQGYGDPLRGYTLNPKP